MRITLQTGQDMKKAPANRCKCFILGSLRLWTRLGLNQRPPDYESGATNRLSGLLLYQNQRVMKPRLDCMALWFT